MGQIICREFLLIWQARRCEIRELIVRFISIPRKIVHAGIGEWISENKTKVLLISIKSIQTLDIASSVSSAQSNVDDKKVQKKQLSLEKLFLGLILEKHRYYSLILMMPQTSSNLPFYRQPWLLPVAALVGILLYMQQVPSKQT